MNDLMARIARAEADATRIEAVEVAAERQFDAAHARAEAAGELASVTLTREFSAWMEARRSTDAAWGAWSLLMDARPTS